MLTVCQRCLSFMFDLPSHLSYVGFSRQLHKGNCMRACVLAQAQAQASLQGCDFTVLAASVHELASRWIPAKIDQVCWLVCVCVESLTMTQATLRCSSANL